MKLTALGSSSRGNGYVLQSDTEALILECGIGLSIAKEAIGFDISKVAGCFISHIHGDHSKYARNYEQTFPTFALPHVIETMDLKRTTAITPLKKLEVGNFTVLPFNANHDVPCVGFVIKHAEIGNLLFLTDSFMLEYDFANINHFLIESNYSDKALEKAIEDGDTNAFMKKRLMTTHMSLSTCCKVLARQDLSNVHNIVLLHLSGNNSDPAEMITEVEKATGKTPTIAKKGVEIELNINPY